MDLWARADHNDDELVAGASENGPTNTLRRTRRLTDSAALSLFRNWLLQDYVAAYCRSLAASRIFKRCYWVDALGIEGRQAGRTDPVEQIAATPEPATRSRKKGVSPIIPPGLQPVVSLAQILAQDSKPISLHGLIMQGGSSKSGRRASTREQRTEGTQAAHPAREIAVPIEGGIVRASWLEAAAQLLKEIEQSPAIFLLNPLGPAIFNYDDLAPLYQRTVPTELCLLIPHKQIEARLPAAHKNQALAAALTSLLRSNRWKALPIEEEKQGEAIAGFIELFLASMQRHFQLPPQRITLPAPSGPASIAPLPYTLIYATRRQDSLLSMNDALCLYQRRTYRESYQGVLGEEWFAQQEQEHRATAEEELAQRIRQQGAAARIRRWPELRQQLVLANFGQFTHNEYDTIIQQLISNKEVQCIWRLPPTTASDSVPGNDDTLQWERHRHQSGGITRGK